ncbi:MAG: hypothetical protein GC166_13030 [Alphaproteobacteria bacterium]|nr:hypothetical protein [Alphaproteobacteria bacterium]
MKPEVDQILQFGAGHLMASIAPLLPPGYDQGTAALTGIVLLLSAQEYDRAADIRVKENAEIRALLGELAGTTNDAKLKADIEAAARSTDPSLAISVLNEGNYALRRLLIDLHTHFDSREDDAARASAKRIWQAMKIFAARRVLTSPTG